MAALAIFFGLLAVGCWLWGDVHRERADRLDEECEELESRCGCLQTECEKVRSQRDEAWANIETIYDHNVDLARRNIDLEQRRKVVFERWWQHRQYRQLVDWKIVKGTGRPWTT